MYALYGGNLELPGGLKLFVDSGSAAAYLQAGGTNRTRHVTIEPGYAGTIPGFTLNGGLLADSGFELLAGYQASIFIEQNGGSHVITN